MMKVGEVARRTGLTVRTLHHYDAIGLLSPGARTSAGHRLYGLPELERLQQIRSLRQLGLSLEQIRDCLDDPSRSLEKTLAAHRATLDRQLDAMRRLRDRLALLERRAGRGEVEIDDLLKTLKETILVERYFTEEQLEALDARRAEVGEDAIEAIQDRWAGLTERVTAAMREGLEPGDDAARALAREWRELARETVAGFTGGDSAIQASLDRAWTEAPEAWGFGLQVRAFMRRALVCLEEDPAPEA